MPYRGRLSCFQSVLLTLLSSSASDIRQSLPAQATLTPILCEESVTIASVRNNVVKTLVDSNIKCLNGKRLLPLTTKDTTRIQPGWKCRPPDLKPSIITGQQSHLEW